MSLDIQTMELSRELKRYAKVNRRSFQEIVNAKSLDLAFQSLKETEKADKAKIEHTLGTVGNKLRVDRKTGKRKKGRRLIKEGSFAARIINYKRRNAGKPMLWGKELEKAANRLISERTRSIGFLKSGWIAAIKKLNKTIKGRDRRRVPRGLLKRGQQSRGTATAAKSTLRPESVIVNAATLNNESARRKIEAGLKKGMRRTIADMHVYIEKKLGRDWRKAGF